MRLLGEEFTGDDDRPIYDIALAAERVAAAVAAAHAGPARLVLTARAENYLYGREDLADTITRLQAYQAAGADVLYPRPDQPGGHQAGGDGGGPPGERPCHARRPSRRRAR